MIVDASVAFKWIVEEADSELALTWLEHGDLKAPAIVHAEVGNAYAKRIRAGELTPDGAPRILDGLASLLPTVEHSEAGGLALTMAIELAHSYYDCVYLAVAELLEEELLTADRVFAKKCEASRWVGRVRTMEAPV